MNKFWQSKKFWIILILIAVGVAGYYYFSSSQEEIALEKEQLEEEYKKDKDEPYSQIQSLSNNTWYRKDFQIRVLDEDLESGIKEGYCQYKVLSYGPGGEEVSSGWKSRKCNSVQTISVGSEGKCLFEGEDSCWVYVRSQDKAGNWYAPSKKELSIKSYNIDRTNPYVSKVIIGEENKANIETTDMFKILGCLLYIDGENQGAMSFLDSKCFNKCSAKKDFNLLDAGTHDIYVRCTDIAGNWGKGEVTQATINTPPVISYCRGLPTSGNKDTEIKFTVDVQDIDNDNLSFSWNFGDGISSQEKEPTHTYSKDNTYNPTVTVSDGKGGEDNCSTAWITIEK